MIREDRGHSNLVWFNTARVAFNITLPEVTTMWTWAGEWWEGNLKDDEFRPEQQELLSFPSPFVLQDLLLDLEQNTIVVVDVNHRLQPLPSLVHCSKTSSRSTKNRGGPQQFQEASIDLQPEYHLWKLEDQPRAGWLLKASFVPHHHHHTSGVEWPIIYDSGSKCILSATVLYLRSPIRGGRFIAFLHSERVFIFHMRSCPLSPWD